MDLNPDNSASTSQSPEQSSNSYSYISLSEHGQFMDNLEAQLLSACKNDPILKDTEVISLLNCCPRYNNNNRQRRFNDQVAAHFQAKVDHHHGRAFLLKIIFFDGQTTEAFVR